MIGEKPECAVLATRHGWQGNLASLQVLEFFNAGVCAHHKLEQVWIEDGQKRDIVAADDICLDQGQFEFAFGEQGHVFR